MVGELITFPLRVGACATRLWMRATTEVVAVAAKATEQLIDAATGRTSVRGPESPPPAPARQAAPRRAPARRTPPREEPSQERRPDEPPAAAPPAPPEEAPPAPPAPEIGAEPPHVSEEAVLVEEFAEPGAEEGAGAELHIEEPWSGYKDMNARQVIARLALASSAEIAAVQLYESANRNRQTILTAAERELQRANGLGQS